MTTISEPSIGSSVGAPLQGTETSQLVGRAKAAKPLERKIERLNVATPLTPESQTIFTLVGAETHSHAA